MLSFYRNICMTIEMLNRSASKQNVIHDNFHYRCHAKYASKIQDLQTLLQKIDTPEYEINAVCEYQQRESELYAGNYLEEEPP